jgi:hypothetical protein
VKGEIADEQEMGKRNREIGYAEETLAGGAGFL